MEVEVEGEVEKEVEVMLELEVEVEVMLEVEEGWSAMGKAKREQKSPVSQAISVTAEWVINGDLDSF